MEIEKVELDASPGPFEVLSVVKTNYRSKQRYAISVRFAWAITPAGDKVQCYRSIVTIQWDRAAETVKDLKEKAVASFDALKAADTSEADLVFNLLHLTL